MKLELADFPVRDVQFSKRTSYDKGLLQINKEELVTLALQDKRIVSADLDVAFPGERTRIAFVRDVVEPRVKVSGPGCIFPGILGPIETVGEGRTHRLSRVTVMALANYKGAIAADESGTTAETRGLVDMWEPGAKVIPYGSLINIVLVLTLVDDVSELEAHTTIQLAEFKVAQQLAETVRHKTPEIMEVFELFEVDPSLPRVVYNLGFISERTAPVSGISFYSLPIRDSLPFFVHPNEFLDGAVTIDARQGGAQKPQNWTWMNPPTILSLLREHGKRLNFLGVIMQRCSFDSETGKYTTAACTSQMAKLLGADAALITSMGGMGNTFIGCMMTVQAYEKKGIKTVLLTAEASGGEGGPPLVFYVPEASAIVSTGDIQRGLTLPAPDKVIGCEKGQLMSWRASDPGFSPWSEVTLDRVYALPDGADWWGNLNYLCKEY